MSTPFGPQLIGETEKTLSALLRRFLDGTGLSEPQWVALQLADALDGGVDDDGLAAALRDRARFSDGGAITTQLTERGLLDGGRLTAGGRELLASVRSQITRGTASIWQDLPSDDVAVAARVLNEVLARAQLVLQ